MQFNRTLKACSITQANHAKSKSGPICFCILLILFDIIKRGAIRIDVHAGAINLYLKPTKQQKEVLRRLIVKNEGYVYIDFGYDEPDHYVEYDGARYTKILSDIDRYFDKGIKS